MKKKLGVFNALKRVYLGFWDLGFRGFGFRASTRGAKRAMRLLSGFSTGALEDVNGVVGYITL